MTLLALTAAALLAVASPPALTDAPEVELQTLTRLLESDSWPRRAIGTMRLERYGCPASRERLVAGLDDPAWQVRVFATAVLGRRREAADAGWFDDEDEPKVIRTALRFRYSIDPERLRRGVRFLDRSGSLSDRLLSVELALASGDETLRIPAAETLKEVILRMKKAEAGALSPRLAAVTGQPDMRRGHRWKRWYMSEGRLVTLRAAYAIPEGDTRPTRSTIASVEPDRLAALLDYMEQLPDRRVDLAICLDTTSSMGGELAEAQGGMDDLMVFGRDVVGQLRVGLVAYRDRRDRYETRVWDFTPNIAEARTRLWQLTADGGGDRPEAVQPALLAAYSKLSWNPEHVKVLILVGDAPPHVGFGEHCVRLAAAAHGQLELTTHVIQAAGKDVQHFPEIAAAGRGRCVTLADNESLIGQVMGLTLGDRYEAEMREFFAAYLVLCR